MAFDGSEKAGSVSRQHTAHQGRAPTALSNKVRKKRGSDSQADKF